jgi:site-specific DNA-methyltransferase (adenine-specific)
MCRYSAYLDKDSKFHPTQKPIYLYDWIFNKYAIEGMKILDTHLGSGSSRISANKAKLNFVGFEIDEEYFNKQEKRYADFTAQTRLW